MKETNSLKSQGFRHVSGVLECVLQSIFLLAVPVDISSKFPSSQVRDYWDYQHNEMEFS